MSRRDVVVVATVSCIYGLGSPKDYIEMMVPLRVGESTDRDALLRKLIDIHTIATTTNSHVASSACGGMSSRCGPPTRISPTASNCGGTRSSGSPSSSRRPATRSNGSMICTSTPPSTSCCRRSGSIAAIKEIQQELDDRLEYFRKEGKLSGSAAAWPARTRFDIEMMQEVG